MLITGKFKDSLIKDLFQGCGQGVEKPQEIIAGGSTAGVTAPMQKERKVTRTQRHTVLSGESHLTGAWHLW